MRRRALLASLATTLTATAGCLGDGSAGGGSKTDDDTATDTDNGTDTRSTTDTSPTDATESATSTETHTPEDPVTETPTPPRASDTFADIDCPSFDETARTVCYHEADLDSAPLVLTAEPEAFGPDTSDDDVETLEFVCYNRSGESVGFNPYDWGIERYDDGEWTHVAPEITPEPWTNLPDGETFTWALPSGPHPSTNDEQRQYVGASLDPGVYAFHVSVMTGEDSRTELIALFEVTTAIDPESESDDGMKTETST